MSYEYSSESGRLDFPNPFRVENVFYFISGLAMLVAAVVLLWYTREQLQAAAPTLRSVLPLIVGLALAIPGFVLCARAMAQLRFFFGRGQPVGLADELPQGYVGSSQPAEALKETLRQGALAIEDPKGAVNGLLYSWLPDLIFAARGVQLLAQGQFHNALVILVTLISLGVCWLGFGNAAHSEWFGLFYLVFGAFLLLRPLESDGGSKARLGIIGLLVLLVIAILGPVLVQLVSKRLPDLSWAWFKTQALWLLGMALFAQLLFFLALRAQTGKPPKTTIACEVAALDLQAVPAQILVELDRVLQSGWPEKIPNRRYIRREPDIPPDTDAGPFRGELLEESQPFPPQAVSKISLGSALSEPRYRWLFWLDVLGFILIVVAAVSLVRFGLNFDPVKPLSESAGLLSFGVVSAVIGIYCLRAAHRIWQRYDFESDIVWVELEGNFTTARMEYGNQWTSNLRSGKNILSIEKMTLRVWAARLQTTILDKHKGRYLIGMVGAPDRAKALSAHLQNFAREQSILVGPTSNEDLKRAMAMAGMSRITEDPKATAAMRENTLHKLQSGANDDTTRPPVQSALFCVHCGSQNPPNARFCSQCGKSITS